MRYKLYKPSDLDLAATAAELTRNPDPAARAHAAQQALPADFRTQLSFPGELTDYEKRLLRPVIGDEVDTACGMPLPWPHTSDLPAWRGLGASHALQQLTPLFHITNSTPHAQAYYSGYLPVVRGTDMPDEHHLSIVGQAASVSELDVETLGQYISCGDVSGLNNQQRAELLVALARHVGASPLVKPWMIVDDKLYPTATCASAIRIAHGLECNVIEVTATEFLGTKMITATAECVDPKTGRTERASAYVSWQVENVTEWKKNDAGKSYPGEKVWADPTPAEVADKIMKAETKAMRRATLSFAAMGTSAAEDVPGKVRETIEPVDDAEFSEREPGWDEAEPPHSDEVGR